MINNSIFRYFLVIIASQFSTILYSQSDQNFKPIDVFNLEYVSNPKISPDGEKIVSHNTLGKDKINPDKIYEKLISIIN